LLLDKARKMRNNPTEAERLLWHYLKNNQLGVHFRQQHPIAGYIPDFVCLNARLIIEIDGGYHLEGEQPELDAERTQWLNQQGFVVLRFTNDEVFAGVDDVLEDITSTLETLSESPIRGGNNASHKTQDSKANQSPLPSGDWGLQSSHQCGCGPTKGSESPIRDGGQEGGGSVGSVGFGYDVHRLVEGRDLWLGGIKIDHTLGLLGHSDADVLIHAICDALLGAANLRDIGYHFPDTSAETLNMDSKIILQKTVQLLRQEGYEVGNIDATVCAERPKLNPHIPAMQRELAQCMQCRDDQVSIKATTTERLGFTGRGEGIAAYAVALVVPAKIE
jgi:2-C-methyl-D-erythritol 2,4-cyclodiphosphate synthase